MLRLGQCCLSWERIGWNKDISCPKSLSYFLATWIFCSGFLSPSMFSSLEKPALEVFQLMFHHNQYVSAKRFCFTKSIIFFFFLARSHFIIDSLSSSICDCSARRPGAHQKLRKSALCCHEMQPWAGFSGAAAGCRGH